MILEQEKVITYTGRTETMICPRCKGNGYFKVLEAKTPYSKRDIVVQCPMCKSKGEIDDETINYDYSGIDTDKLQ
tara:strand:- start:515 stop:739 length:225 start_codon:yes stop_codon:yes gene_type:complete